MRFERLIIQNYRQFKDIDISFKEDHLQDLSIIIGKNGTGKTNFLNAINWCLYGDEPHLSKDSQQLPKLNLKFLENIKKGDEIEVVVQLWILVNDNQNSVIFTRKEIHRINKNNQPIFLDIEFKVETTDHLGNNKIFVDDEALKQVNRFVPFNIREYFFFDGERLDNYFKRQTSKDGKIRKAIMEISRIKILDDIEKHLSNIESDIRKEAGKLNPKVELTREELNEVANKKEELKENRKEHRNQKDIAEEEKEKIIQKLIEFPNVQKQEDERKKLIQRKKNKEELLVENNKEKEILLLKYGKKLMLWGAIQKSLSIIENGIKEKKVPPPIQEFVLRDSLRSAECEICGRPLDEHSKEYVEELIKKIDFSSKIGDQLSQMVNPLRNFKKDIENFDQEIKDKNKTIEDIKSDLVIIVSELNDIEIFLDNYDLETAKDLHKRRKNYEQSISRHERMIGEINNQLKELDKKKAQLEITLSKQMLEEKELISLRKELHFASKALETVVIAKRNIIEETREKVQLKTKEIFFDLLWKKETFSDVIIDDLYNVNLIHNLGYECLGTVSAAESELLALSFTLALHDISGFNSPILIDTPLARVSDEHRENFGKIFQEISYKKQVILLLTPAEYSKEIKNLLDNRISNKFINQMSSDEIEVYIEEI